MTAMFDLYDKNSDGRLTTRELAIAMAETHALDVSLVSERAPPARFNLVLKKDVSIRPQVLLSGTRRSPGGLCRDSRDPRQGHLSSGFFALHAQSSPRERTEHITAQRCSRAAFPANPSVFPCAARALAKTKNQAWPGLA